MNIVLLSGGSGKRLWPLSNDTQSKQFLKLLKNESGEYESMVQRVMSQIKSTQPSANIFISCNKTQVDVLHRQLGEVEIISEPLRRDTFPAIALAAAYLHYKKHLGAEEIMVVCPIDVFAERTYFELLSKVEEIVARKMNKIGLLGANPVYPSSKYGYILLQEGQATGFVEKPCMDEAERFIAEGALWNCGVFSIKIGDILKRTMKYVKFESYEAIYEHYDKLPKISFDYEVVEEEPSIGVVVYNGIWKDLGTWNTLTEEMNTNMLGDKIIISESCQNTHILNMLNLPVIVNDLKDSVIVVSHDGVLVSSKPGSSLLKPLTDKINLRPMYEQRVWGSYRVLEYVQADENTSLIKRLRIDAGRSLSYQYHSKRTITWIIVSGKGILTIGEVDSVISPYDVIKIPKNEKYSVSAIINLEFIEVQMGLEELEEDDIARIGE